jgi:hypothetical protein
VRLVAEGHRRRRIVVIRSTAVKIARASWVVPVGAFLAGALLRYRPDGGDSGSAREQGAAEGAACAFLVFYLLGLTLAIIALVQSGRHGPAGIRGPAFLGATLNVVLLVLAVVLMFAR